MLLTVNKVNTVGPRSGRASEGGALVYRADIHTLDSGAEMTVGRPASCSPRLAPLPSPGRFFGTPSSRHGGTRGLQRSAW
jgi:hypothetical protein